MYEDEEALALFLEAKQIYQDRGMMKWAGFYLSDHTATLTKDAQKRKKHNPPKEVMTPIAIDQVIQKAYTSYRLVAIQVKELDEENCYFDDLVGKIQGQSDLGIYLANPDGLIAVAVSSIRHIEILPPQKILTKEN